MALFHLAVLFAFTFITLLISPASSKHVDQNPTKSDIKTWCSETPHPQDCEYFFSHNPKYSSPIKGKPDFLKKSLLIALERAMHAEAHTYGLKSKCRNERETAAWRDCLELYATAVQQMNATVDPQTKCSTADAQTWLSAALTSFDTCHQGFVETGSEDNIMPLMNNSVANLISNTLALNKAPLSVEPRYKKGFPEWVTDGERKLLQAASPAANIVVAQDGSGTYRTIGEAVAAAAKLTGKGRIVIQIKAGAYSENVEVGKKVKNVMFVGDGIGKTIITGSKSVGGGGTTTFRSATVAAVGEGFIARGITFRNTAGPAKHQAVAFRSGSDLSVMYQCSFEGYQDTLYVHSNRQFYKECDIYGTVDFIFGNAAAVLQNCNIYARNPPNKINTITAQGRMDPNQNTGISIINSRVMAAPGLPGSVATYLGRPWKQYSRTVFMKTVLDGLVSPAGWYPWNGNFALNTLYYGEYANTGAGSSTAKRVSWKGFRVITSPAEASQFTVAKFIGGSSWLPATNVPFTPDL